MFNVGECDHAMVQSLGLRANLVSGKVERYGTSSYFIGRSTLLCNFVLRCHNYPRLQPWNVDRLIRRWTPFSWSWQKCFVYSAWTRGVALVISTMWGVQRYDMVGMRRIPLHTVGTTYEYVQWTVCKWYHTSCQVCDQINVVPLDRHM